MRAALSASRWAAIVIKEFIQLRRDRLTFGMIVGIPVIQLLLFGFAINSDPKHLPTAVLAEDHSPYSRSIVAALQNSGYFALAVAARSSREVDALLARGEVQFAVTIPQDFSRRLVRNERPVLLVEADATDPAATSNALAALGTLVDAVVARDAAGVLQPRPPLPPRVDVRVQRRYNPEGITQYNVVPGLLGVILTMTMVLMTGLALTRERERGTYENLLATPVRPIEVMTGKVVPYILIGLLQVALVLAGARYVFGVPFLGSLVLLFFVVLLFIAANLTLGITFSSLARNQLQAMQMTFFYFLPSILLSGFMFPFRGMPGWAQWIGNLLPLTHFLVLVRGILLKGNGVTELWPAIWPIAAFTVAAITVGVTFYRRTLD
ncbi:MAG: ABC transporter permease [Burkholderiales bacterium]|nr:ABC transporter permease [Burkholderiales bacterium]OJX05791.1 MAG: mannose-1-phosphate guanyltransferase [Burkholderiales bacterium 70-64]